jgi:hypothetical protein
MWSSCITSSLQPYPSQTKTFLLPKQASPLILYQSEQEQEQEQESNLSNIYEQNQARPIEQSQISGFNPHISSHLISSHPMTMIATGRGRNSFFLSFLRLYPTCIYAFSKLF